MGSPEADRPPQNSLPDSPRPALHFGSIADAGYSVYRTPEAVNVDCAEMRLLKDHLWHLSEICQDLLIRPDLLTTQAQDKVEQEWPRVVRWLRMAAGLRYVDVDVAYGEPMLMLCGRADEYHEAASDTASSFVTEQTRLLYTWNAVERLLKLLRLPPVDEASAPYNRATQLLRDYWTGRDLPSHFNCVLKHLRAHAEGDSWLKSEKRLLAAFEERDWRGTSGMLLAAANQLRHLPAHGDLDMPEPVTWGPGYTGPEEYVAPLLHAPRLAVRGLALSFQMLLLARNPSASLADFRTPRGGWSVLGGDGQWSSQVPAWRSLIEQAHLLPPRADEYGLYDPEAVEEEW
jgi:hypothetical protein